MTVINPSPTRHYVIKVFNPDFTGFSFREFRLPKEVENSCSNATWYFYNRLDLMACGEEAYPHHMHTNITEMAPALPEACWV